jgi:D-sedoheptulose 7-phosphate isomerase
MDECTEICLKIPSKKTPRIQEDHILVWHLICDFIEKKLFDNK